MSGHFLIDASALAVSLFNAGLLFWLGLTVMLNAERRSVGLFFAVLGLLTGSGFFIAHSIILSQGAILLLRGFGFWWPVGWLTIIAAPYAWYLMMLWYTGYWDETSSPLRRRQAPWLALSGVYAAVLGTLLLLSNPLPEVSQGGFLLVDSLPSLGPVPLIVLAYPPFSLLCMGMALDALLRPAPSGRVMGDIARRRARPWLTGATLVLLLAGLIVAAVFVWLTGVARLHLTISDLLVLFSGALSLLDLALAILLMTAILLLSRAIVAYEIFTGQTLPRRGFLIQWKVTIGLLGLLSTLPALGVTGHIPPILTGLALLFGAAFAFALSGWISFGERERSMRQLRPFTTSHRLLDSILTPDGAEGGELDLAAPFTALCRDVLGVRQAVLAPHGTLAGLGLRPLRYPAGDETSLPDLSGLVLHFSSPQTIGAALEPAAPGGMVWASPLWSEHGLTGLLLLGEKVDGGFYSQEEIEIARASGERLADIAASAELARRLAALQRSRLSESGVLDHRLRRTLHDDVLPPLHTALLQLSGAAANLPGGGTEMLDLLSDAHRRISKLLRDLPEPGDPLLVKRGLFAALRRLLESELAGSFASVAWEIEPGAEESARSLPLLTQEVIYYAAREALRNAARHARPSDAAQPLRLVVSAHTGDGLEICVQDNGPGLPSAGTAWLDSGHGLALHTTMMALVGGSLSIDSLAGFGAKVILKIYD
jgi:signal transduction histidine kinase